jgi:hypothetical protein
MLIEIVFPESAGKQKKGGYLESIARQLNDYKKTQK